MLLTFPDSGGQLWLTGSVSALKATERGAVPAGTTRMHPALSTGCRERTEIDRIAASVQVTGPVVCGECPPALPPYIQVYPRYALSED